MKDCVYINRGAVYELQTTNNNENLYLVISNNQFQGESPNVVLCTVRLGLSTTDYESPYYIPIECKMGRDTLQMVVCVESLFNARTNRLVNYRFTLSEQIMQKVDEVIKQIFFGQPMYTLNEAIVELYKAEKTPLNPQQQKDTFTMEIDEDSMTVDELQAYYARQIEAERQEQEVSTPAPLPSKSKKPRAQVDYSYIYNQYEDFLLDYYTMENAEFLGKWDLTYDEVEGWVTWCKQISKKNGDDQSIWKEFGKQRKRVRRQEVI